MKRFAPRHGLARRIRDLEKRVRGLETDKAIEYAAESEILGMDETVRKAVVTLVSGLRFHGRSSGGKLEATIGSALTILAPAVAEMVFEHGAAAAHDAIDPDEGSTDVAAIY